MAKSNLKLAPKLTLESMIDEYGRLSEEKNLIEKQQKNLKMIIDSQIALQEGAMVITVEGELFKAEKFLPEKTVVNPQGVWEYSQDTFWRIVKITLTDAQAVLPSDVLHDVTTVEVGSIPQLKISKKKIEKES